MLFFSKNLSDCVISKILNSFISILGFFSIKNLFLEILIGFGWSGRLILLQTESINQYRPNKCFFVCRHVNIVKWCTYLSILLSIFPIFNDNFLIMCIQCLHIYIYIPTIYYIFFYIFNIFKVFECVYLESNPARLPPTTKWMK